VTDTADLVTDFWEHPRRSRSARRAERLSAGEFGWAYEEVEDRVRREPTEAFALLVALDDGAPDDAALAYLGAGPVEDLLRYCGSVVVFDRVAGWARRTENFRKALRCAWFEDDVPKSVAARLRAFGEPY
jgi:hypothetical protein